MEISTTNHTGHRRSRFYRIACCAPVCQQVSFCITLSIFDALTYAGNLENLKDVQDAYPNYIFEKGDINDEQFIDKLFGKYHFDAVIHLAAESHVDRSIIDPLSFVKTNVLGTATLLNACRKFWKKEPDG